MLLIAFQNSAQVPLTRSRRSLRNSSSTSGILTSMGKTCRKFAIGDGPGVTKMPDWLPMNAKPALEEPAEVPTRKADSCVMVIFGASGDLTKRKLIPALCNLARDKLLSQQFAVVGFATRDYTTET